MRCLITIAALFALASPAVAAKPVPNVPVNAAPSPSEALRSKVAAILAAAPQGTRFGVLVFDDKGSEVLAINPDQRFIPASNTKLFTTAAAFAVLSADPAQAESEAMTTIALRQSGKGAPDVVLTGGGTALSNALYCTRRCFGALISGIAPKARKVGNVVADDTAFTDQRWSPGMSWNNIPSDSGTAASAIVIDDNELPLLVTPGTAGQQAQVAVSSYFTVQNEVQTIADGETRIGFDRAINSRNLRMFGTIRADAQAWHDKLGIDDPADYAGWLVRDGLIARGIKVSGKVIVRHRAIAQAPLPAAVTGSSLLAIGVTPQPLAEEAALINKVSQNLRAEVLLRRIGRHAAGQDLFASPAPTDGTLEAGLAAMRDVLEKAGITRAGYDFSDGSGMSTYNRISPRAAVQLLRWGQGQPWGVAWRASLPVGGVDGTLRRRFVGSPLEGKVWAKTGTLNATNTLSGYVQAASGRELTFSILANDVPDGASAVAAIDMSLLAIAAAN